MDRLVGVGCSLFSYGLPFRIWSYCVHVLIAPLVLASSHVRTEPESDIGQTRRKKILFLFYQVLLRRRS